MLSILTVALLARLLVASAGECYLVTADGIYDIPCDFSAATTDALRYGAEDSPAATARRAEQQERDTLERRRGPRGSAFPRSARRRDSRSR